MKIQNSDKRYDAIVFDFDNTIFDYALTERNALCAVFNELNIPFHIEYAILFRKINSRLWDDTEKDGHFAKGDLRKRRFYQLFETLNVPVSSELVTKAADSFIQYSRIGVLIEGVADVLCTLKAQEYILGIASAGLSDPRIHKLNNSEIAHLIDFAMYREDFDNCMVKPHPDFYDRIAKKLESIPRKRILYVGDTFESDVKASSLAGFSSVWFNYFGLDTKEVTMGSRCQIINHFTELLSILEEE